MKRFVGIVFGLLMILLSGCKNFLIEGDVTEYRYSNGVGFSGWSEFYKAELTQEGKCLLTYREVERIFVNEYEGELAEDETIEDDYKIKQRTAVVEREVFDEIDKIFMKYRMYSYKERYEDKTVYDLNSWSYYIVKGGVKYQSSGYALSPKKNGMPEINRYIKSRIYEN